jgi:hypothetical protein
MLLIEIRESLQLLDAVTRQILLDRLQEKGLTPLIRSTRNAMFENLVTGSTSQRRIERALSEYSEKNGEGPYFPGDIFCFEDHALFLIFDSMDTGHGMKAGIVNLPGCFEPSRKLDVFCRNIQDALESPMDDGRPLIEGGFANWSETQPLQSRVEKFEDVSPIAKSSVLERARSLGVLDDPAARRFLQHICEAYDEGRIVELLSRAEADTAGGLMVRRFAEAGLLRREILVSCRKRTRPLFRLPSQEALAQITASDAVCSECGAKLADEKFDELIIPNEAATTLLNDGSWIAGRIRSIVHHLGVPESNVTVRQAEGEALIDVLIVVGTERFLISLVDGDIAVADVRKLQLAAGESAAANLVVVATGRIHDDARQRLREFARRRSSQRQHLNLALAEGIESVSQILEQMFEEASNKALVNALFPLDAGLGFSAGQLLSLRFRFAGNEPAPVFPKASITTNVEPVNVGFDNF